MKHTFASVSTADHAVCSMRRGLLVAPLLAAPPLTLSDETARAGKIDPAEMARLREKTKAVNDKFIKEYGEATAKDIYAEIAKIRGK